MAFVLMDITTYAAGYRVAWLITMTIYSIPVFDFGRGPTHSIMRCSKGADWIGFNGAGLMVT